MIAIITLQSIDGDCPSNIVIDVDKLKSLTIDDCKRMHDRAEISEEEKLRYAKDDLKDAEIYVKIIVGEIYPDGSSVPNPNGWEVLELVKVELPQMVDYTDVIFYGNY